MREIKFRVWDKINKKWIKQFNIDLLNVDISELPNIEISQYTGFKDINGKEIYEGDILKSDMEVLRVEEVVYDEDNARFALKYKEEIYNITEEIYNITEERIQKLNLKVIGNIYDKRS